MVKRNEPKRKLSDNLVCPVDSLFNCQYQLSCKNLWHYCITIHFFLSIDRMRLVVLFEVGGF